MLKPGNTSNRFKLRSHAGVRVAARPRFAHTPAARPAAVDFAARLARRYQQWSAPFSRLSQVFPALRQTIIERHLHQHSVNLAPRLSLTLKLAETAFHQSTEKAKRNEPNVNQRRAMRDEQLVPRIFARGQREESLPVVAAETSRRVHARPGAARADAVDAPTTEHDRHAAPTSIVRRAADERPRSLETPAVDVKRLAEQVMQTIDRRLLSERERLGRI